ncbi:dihydroorotate dehydrogenase B catalytic subunit [bacterium Unc6]|nr:dihydroorotate dehydrogenase B catalytic subunit [bacterium Unc6]
MDIDLSTNIGIKLKKPVLLASGTAGYGEEISKWIDVKSIGAIVTKTITLKPREGNPFPRICETPSGMLNSIGLQNSGLNHFIKNIVPEIKKLGVPIVVSIAGKNTEEYGKIAKKIEQCGVDAIEINLSCPNVGYKELIAQNTKSSYNVVRVVKKSVKVPVISKLSPQVTDIKIIAKTVQDAGTDAISLINTLPGMAIDIKERKPKIGNIIGGLSGPAIKPVALRMVYEVYNSVQVPIIGMGGILSAQDALEFIIAGASAVAVGVGNFINPQIGAEIISGLKKYLLENKIYKIGKLVGRLNTNKMVLNQA